MTVINLQGTDASGTKLRDMPFMDVYIRVDKAGKGISSPASLLSAIKTAQLLYKNKDIT